MATMLDEISNLKIKVKELNEENDNLRKENIEIKGEFF